MPKPIILLVRFLAITGGILYLYSVIYACYVSIPKICDNCKMDEFLSGIVTSFGAVFSTNLGAMIGIAVTNPNSLLRNTKTWRPFRIFSEPDTEAFQVLFSYIYVFSLLLAAIVWVGGNFNESVHPLIPQLTKTLVGVIGGIFAVLLNKTN